MGVLNCVVHLVINLMVWLKGAKNWHILLYDLKLYLSDLLRTADATQPNQFHNHNNHLSLPSKRFRIHLIQSEEIFSLLF